MKIEPSRRDVLRLAGLAGVAGLAAACTSSGSPSPSTSPAPTSTTPTLATTPAPVSTPPSTSAAPAPTYTDLGKQLSGRLATPGQSAYQPQKLLYNPRFGDQPKPQAIAACSRSTDVLDCVRFAAAGGASLRVRNGGHSYGGWSSGPGLVADLGAMNSISVDHDAMTATIGAGARLADVYSALADKGVAIGAGSCATVGVTGLTLGGGVGLLTRNYGLTCDQLASAQVVTSDGRMRTVSAQQDPDLFWALRGGGGSFAAVTSLTFTVHEAPRMHEVFLQWSGSDAADVVAAWQDWTAGTPRELWSTCKVLARPGEGVRAVVAAFWSGSGTPSAQVAKLLANTPNPTTNSPSSRTYGSAMLASAGCYGSASACISAALTPAQRQPEAAASAIVQKALPDKAIGALVDAVNAGMDVTGMIEGGVSFDALGGAVSDLAPTDTAFPWRSALADVQYTATWNYDDALKNRDRYDAFVQSERQALQPYLGDSAYSNYADPSLKNYATAYWGTNLAKLQQVKKTYDSGNIFSFPQSVPLT